MTVDEIRELINLAAETGVAELEVQRGDNRVRIRRTSGGRHVGFAPMGAQPAASAPPGPAPAPPQAPSAATSDSEMLVKSPIVGTFYRSPEPGAPPFVEIGSQVKKGQVLCIIEAMKLMNEIDSEYDGEIANVYVEGGQPVQYGERLFAIRTK